jgi:hypothetical protein
MDDSSSPRPNLQILIKMTGLLFKIICIHNSKNNCQEFIQPVLNNSATKVLNCINYAIFQSLLLVNVQLSNQN